MNAAVSSSRVAPPTVRSADRLGFTLMLAALLHAALLLGVGFAFPEAAPPSKSLEVTLSTFSQEQKPDKADFLAADNQQGSGSLEQAERPRTTELAPFQDTRINPVAQAAPTPPPSPPQPQKVLTTRAPQPQQVAEDKAQQPPSPEQPTVTPDAERARLSDEIASLEAELAEERELYAKRPKIHRLNAASTMRDKGAWYKEAWRKKVEQVGNLNYPDEARRARIYGQLRLLVSINRDGSLYEVQVLESSGQPVLDRAAQRIVRLAAPYAPFSGDLADIDRLEIIRTWRFERGDRLSSR